MKIIEIRASGSSDHGKTGIWRVFNIESIDNAQQCGQIRWNDRWQEYCFYCGDLLPPIDSFNLRLIADFCQKITKEHNILNP